MIVRFVSGGLPKEPPPVGTLAFGPGKEARLGTPDAIPAAIARRSLPRLMREAGQIFAEALNAQI
jgi:hypothetical protein